MFFVCLSIIFYQHLFILKVEIWRNISDAFLCRYAPKCESILFLYLKTNVRNHVSLILLAVEICASCELLYLSYSIFQLIKKKNNISTICSHVNGHIKYLCRNFFLYQPRKASIFKIWNLRHFYIFIGQICKAVSTLYDFKKLHKNAIKFNLFHKTICFIYCLLKQYNVIWMSA